MFNIYTLFRLLRLLLSLYFVAESMVRVVVSSFFVVVALASGGKKLRNYFINFFFIVQSGLFYGVVTILNASARLRELQCEQL